MNCPICKHGRPTPDHTAVTLRRDGTTVVFEDVPALICDACGEEFVSDQTTRDLLTTANNAPHAGVRLELRTFQPA